MQGFVTQPVGKGDRHNMLDQRNVQGANIACERNVQKTDITSERNVQGTNPLCERNVQGTESCLHFWTLHQRRLSLVGRIRLRMGANAQIGEN